MEQISLNWEPERRVYTVSELTAAIRVLLGKSFDDIWISGEVSGVKLHSSGHAYFALKDGGAQVRCVCFKTALRYLKFRPQEGVAVVARGRIDVYDPRGEYQFIVETMEPQGFGALQLAYEQLKKRLEAEGMFAAARKRALPKFPRRIGIISSPTGAAIRDVIHVLERRFPGLHLRLYPALVQGAGSVEAVVSGLDYFSKSRWPDVVLLCRGGGSLQDLWTFNEEAVARAIARCAVPVVSAVGHETDYTIADFVADLRAPTPSAAAEILICTKAELLEQVAGCIRSARRAMQYRLAAAASQVNRQGIERATANLHRRVGRAGQRVDEMETRIREMWRGRQAQRLRRLQELDLRLRAIDPRVRLSQTHRRLEALDGALTRAMRHQIAQGHRELAPLAAGLVQLSPLRVLERGYAIVENAAGHVLRNSTEAAIGESIRVRLHQGRLAATVTGKLEKEIAEE